MLIRSCSPPGGELLEAALLTAAEVPFGAIPGCAAGRQMLMLNTFAPGRESNNVTNSVAVVPLERTQYVSAQFNACEWSCGPTATGFLRGPLAAPIESSKLCLLRHFFPQVSFSQSGLA